MEKYARQAIADGVKTPNELVVTTDAEIYRVLILHYNRNNQIEVWSSVLFHLISRHIMQQSNRGMIISFINNQIEVWSSVLFHLISRHIIKTRAHELWTVQWNQSVIEIEYKIALILS